MEYEKNPSKYSKIRGVLSRIMTGGSAPPPELIKWYKNNLNVDVVQIWGMTEMNPLGTYGRRICRRSDLNKSDNELILNQMCCGIPFPTLEMKIVDPEITRNCGVFVILLLHYCCMVFCRCMVFILLSDGCCMVFNLL